MEQEYKISEESKRTFLIFACGSFLFFLGFVYLGVLSWQDSASTTFRKYVFIPWFIVYTWLRAITQLYNGFFMKIKTNENYIKFESFGITVVTDWSNKKEYPGII